MSAVQQNRSPHPSRSCSNLVSETKNQELYRKEASFLNMWIFCMSLSKGSESEESFSLSKSCYCSPMAFSDFCLRSFRFEAQPRTQGHTNKPTWQISHVSVLFQQGFRLKLLPISLTWRRTCWHIETVQYSWGHFHPWGDKGYSLKTCNVQVFT